jgi:hypothetical protein
MPRFGMCDGAARAFPLHFESFTSCANGGVGRQLWQLSAGIMA